MYCDIAYNDLEISADKQMVDGVEYALITLKNDALRDGEGGAAGVTPKITAMIDGRIVSQIFLGSELDGGFSRTLLVPVTNLTGGSPYQELELVVTSRDTNNEVICSDVEAQHAQAYREVNLYSNTAVLAATNDFVVASPVDVTVFDGENAVFSVAAGGTNPLTYQWYVLFADGTSQAIAGATSPTLTISKASLALSGRRYWCRVSDGITLLDTTPATLTVVTHPPLTGDDAPTDLLILLLCLSTAACAVLLATQRRGRKRG